MTYECMGSPSKSSPVLEKLRSALRRFERPVPPGGHKPLRKPKDLIDRRMASALFRNVDPKTARSATVGSGGKLALRIVERVMGGVWIGGDAWLTPERLIFEPNAMNRDAHGKRKPAELRVMLALDDITRVGWRKALGTSIIEVETPERTLSLRCYRSKRFAEAIRCAAGLDEAPA